MALCDVERERRDRIKVDVFGASGARSLRMGRLYGNAETSARLFSPTVMWPTGASPPLLCVGFGERGGWGGGLSTNTCL